MRSSTWKEDLIDPGLLLDLLEAEDKRCVAEVRRVQKRNTATVEASDAGKPNT
jgi:hypothetical protein